MIAGERGRDDWTDGGGGSIAKHSKFRGCNEDALSRDGLRKLQKFQFLNASNETAKRD